MNKKLYWGLFALAFIVAIIFRVVLPFGYTVTDDGIRYSQADGYYQLRIADNLASTHHNPSYEYYILPFEPSTIQNFLMVFPTLIYLISRIGISVDMVALIINPLLGLITLLLIYLIARKLFDKNIALFSLLLSSIIAGDFLYRTALGYTDQHSLEIVLLLSSFLFLLMSFNKQVLSIIYSAIAGVFAGLYLALFPGGLIIIGAYSLYALVLILINKDKEVLLNVMSRIVIILCVGVMAYMLVGRINYNYVILIMALTFGIIVLALVKYYLITINKTWVIYTLFIPIIGVCIAGVMLIPSLQEIFNRVAYYITWNTNTVIGEEQPLLFNMGQFTLGQIWANWGIVFFIFLIGLGMLASQYKKTKSREILFLLVISVFLLIITLSERRFAYYLSAFVAIVSVYSLMLVYKYLQPKVNKLMVYYGVVIAFICLPLLTYSSFIAKPLNEYMSDDWHDALVWIRENTSEPLNEANYYSYLRKENSPNYMVLSWWDYGYWIIREGQRVPLVHNGSGYWEIASQILVGDQKTSVDLLRQYKIKYIIIDKDMVSGKLNNIAQYVKDDPYKGLAVNLYWMDTPIGFDNVYQNGTVKIFEVK